MEVTDVLLTHVVEAGGGQAKHKVAIHQPLLVRQHACQLSAELAALFRC